MVLREKHGPEIDTIISRYAQKRSAVLPVLYIAQDEYGHLTDAAIREVAQILDISVNTIDVHMAQALKKISEVINLSFIKTK